MTMSADDLIHRSRKFAAPYRVTKGKGFRLRDVDPGDTAGLKSDQKESAREVLQNGVAGLSALQELLYAQDRWAVLLIFQAMDAAGKDSSIQHVMSGINPQGCQVFSFKAPSSEDLDHDYLWRCLRSLPERGRIGIFNRSYYEEVLIVRVHQELLAKQKIPPSLVTEAIWEQRYEDIRNVERYLGRNGIAICKFFLHVSKKEQKRRFLERLDDPDKHWKFSPTDAGERAYWSQYMEAYEEMIRNTATPEAPWYVVPADNKWFTRLVVAAAAIDTLAGLNLKYPDLSKDEIKELAAARRKLLRS
jgi:PPK2 family polyphosphate:nucleotide phosphotransferase